MNLGCMPLYEIPEIDYASHYSVQVVVQGTVAVE